MKEKVTIITGISGEIGQNLIEYFLKNTNKKIIGIDLDNSKQNSQIFKFINASILDQKILDEIANDYIIEEIYHLAAILSTKAEKNPELAEKVNISGTINMFNFALYQNFKHNILTKFFFPSSIAVYQVNQNDDSSLFVQEQMLCNPKTIYGQHKLFCENLGTSYDQNGNELNLKIDFRCIRFPGIISANSMPTGGTSDYAPEMIHNAFKKKKYSCFVNKTSILPFIVMPDAIQSIINIMSSNKKSLTQNVYNITSFSPTVSDILNEIKNECPSFKIDYKINKQRQKIVNNWPNFIDDSKAKNDWGWLPKYDLSSAFKNYLTPILK